MSQTSTCLNCNNQVSGNFCNNCGQKTDIHRITFKHFIAHDVLHGLFHVEKGMLFTAKESLTRPGKAALDYIEGKRIRYYNVFYFILLLIGLNLFLSNYYDKLSGIYIGQTFAEESNVTGKKFEHFFTDYAKILIFSFVPLFAVNSFLLFRKRRLNFSEHFIIAGITFLGILLIITADSIVSLLDFTKYFDSVSGYFSFFTSFAVLFFPIFSYYQTFKDYYKKMYFSMRMLVFTLMIIFELVVFMLLIYGYVSDWNFGPLSYRA